MTEPNKYLKIELLMEGNVTFTHLECLTTNESITFNNFIAKFGRNANGFLTIKEEDSFSSVNVNKILKLSPQGIEEI